MSTSSRSEHETEIQSLSPKGSEKTEVTHPYLQRIKINLKIIVKRISKHCSCISVHGISRKMMGPLHLSIKLTCGALSSRKIGLFNTTAFATQARGVNSSRRLIASLNVSGY